MSLRLRARPYWLRLHRWLGLALGLWFTLLGLTGSVLVFYVELGEWPARAMMSRGEPPAVDPDAVLATLRAIEPQRQGAWRIEMPLADDRPLRARYYRPIERGGAMFAPLMVTLDPRSLEVLQRYFWADEPLTWIYDLHYSLLLDRPGRTAVGVIGLALGLSLISGAWLWWPSSARARAAWQPRLRPGAMRGLYDLHALSGLYGALLLLMLALTGAALALPEVTQALLAPAVDMHLSSAPKPAAPPASAALKLVDAVAIARARWPEGEPRWIESSGETASPIFIRLYQPGEPSRRFPRTLIWIDSISGEVLRVNDAAHARSGDQVLAWLHPLHNGEVFGLVGRMLVCALGLLPSLLLITGWMRWRRKRRAWRGARESSAHRAPL